jgi:hypothetical protein
MESEEFALVRNRARLIIRCKKCVKAITTNIEIDIEIDLDTDT